MTRQGSLLGMITKQAFVEYLSSGQMGYILEDPVLKGARWR